MQLPVLPSDHSLIGVQLDTPSQRMHNRVRSAQSSLRLDASLMLQVDKIASERGFEDRAGVSMRERMQTMAPQGVPVPHQQKLYVTAAQLQTWRQERSAAQRARARQDQSCVSKLCGWLCGGSTVVGREPALPVRR